MKGIQVYSNEGPRPFPRADNYEIAKIHWQNLKIFFSKTTWPFSTKLVTMRPWVKGIEVCLNEGPNPFPRGYNYEIAKIHWRILKNLILQNFWAYFHHFGTKHLGWRGFKCFLTEEPLNSQKVNHMCLLISQVSDVAHGPLFPLCY